MEADERLSLIAAAATAVGAGENEAEWSEKVRELAIDLYLMSRGRSPVSRMLERLDASPTYVATVLGGRVEKHALEGGGKLRRGLIRLKVASSRYNKDGVEEIRAELLNPGGCRPVGEDPLAE